MQTNNISKIAADSPFFQKYSHQLKSIIESSKFQQQKARKIRKIQVLKQQSQPNQSQIAQKLLDNIIIDYLRNYNLNYTYTVLMRERNLISQQILTKSKLIQQLQLKSQYDKTGFGTTVIQLILNKLADTNQHKIDALEIGVQVELIMKDNTVNNRLINQIRISETRKEVQDKQKKYFQKMLAALKQQLTITIKDDLKKEFQKKNREMKNQYERQVQVLKQKNKQFLVNNPKMHPKVEEYLSKIEELQSKNTKLISANRQLQKDKLSHNCLDNRQIVQRQNQVKKIKMQLQKRKKQYELALANMHTSVEQLVTKKQKLLVQPKQTDIFMNQIRKNKQSKDHMIEEIYGRIFVMDKRIQSLSQDNNTLRQQNRQLTCKLKQFQSQNKKIIQQLQESTQKANTAQYALTKPKSKDVILGVTESQINQFINKKQRIIDQQEQIQNQQSQQKEIDLKKQHRMQVNSLQSQMKLIKNRLRLMVQEFN